MVKARDAKRENPFGHGRIFCGRWFLERLAGPEKLSTGLDLTVITAVIKYHQEALQPFD